MVSKFHCICVLMMVDLFRLCGLVCQTVRFLIFCFEMFLFLGHCRASIVSNLLFQCFVDFVAVALRFGLLWFARKYVFDFQMLFRRRNLTVWVSMVSNSLFCCVRFCRALVVFDLFCWCRLDCQCVRFCFWNSFISRDIVRFSRFRICSLSDRLFFSMVHLRGRCKIVMVSQRCFVFFRSCCCCCCCALLIFDLPGLYGLELPAGAFCILEYFVFRAIVRVIVVWILLLLFRSGDF